MKTALKIRLYPTRQQQQKLAIQFGCVRWVWNNALAFKQCAYQERQENLSGYTLKARLPQLKAEHAWLKEADSQALQQSILHLDKAFRSFFAKRTRKPRFKSKRNRQSIQYPQRVKVDRENHKLYLPKVGWVKGVFHREVTGKLKTVTVCCTSSGEYAAALLLEQEGEPQPAVIEQVEAVDVGLKDILVTASGYKSGNPRPLKRAERNLKRKQKKLSHKQKGTQNWVKAKKKLAKAHAKVKRVRYDWQHKQTKRIADENQAVIVESLHIKGMLKNHKLSKAIADAGWYSLLSKLEYKLKRKGGILVKIDRLFPSSKRCHACQHVVAELPLRIRMWQCPRCRLWHDRDINAARNILAEGIKILQAAGQSVSAGGGLCQTRDILAVADEPRSSRL